MIGKRIAELNGIWEAEDIFYTFLGFYLIWELKILLTIPNNGSFYDTCEILRP